MARTESYWDKVDNSYVVPEGDGGLDVLIGGTNKYLNFNSLVGTTGYGFRDSDGSMQVKDSGGAWSDIATAADLEDYFYLPGRAAGQEAFGGSTGSGADLTLRSNPEDDGDILLGTDLLVKPNGSAINSIGHLSWTRSSLYEQSGGGSPDRFFYKCIGDRWELLNEAGTQFLMSTRGANATRPFSLYWVGSVAIGAGYFNGLLPTNGLVVQGFTGHGRLFTVEPPQAMLHIREYQRDEITRFEGQTDYGYTTYYTYVRGSNELRGLIGYDDDGGTLITNSLNDSFIIRGANGVTFGQGTSLTGAYLRDTNDETRWWFGNSAPSANSTVHVDGSFAKKRVNQDSDATLGEAYYYEGDVSKAAGDLTYTLPPAANVEGREYCIVRTDGGANNLVIDGNGAETINGAATYTLAGQYDTVTLWSNGSEWFIKCVN